MSLDIPLVENWTALNLEIERYYLKDDELKDSELKDDDLPLLDPTRSTPRSWAGSESFRLYKGVYLATFELGTALASLYAHKRAFGSVDGNSPCHSVLTLPLVRDGYLHQKIGFQELRSQPELLQPWVEGLHKDTVFVLISEDHVLSGEIEPWVEQLENALAQKKIYTIIITHHRHYISRRKTLPYSLHIYSFGLDLAVARLGSRYKVSHLVAPYFHWDKHDIEKHFHSRIRNVEENEKAVRAFESTLKKFPSMIAEGLPRVWNRSALRMPGVNCEALFQVIRDMLQIEARELELDLLSRCHHAGAHVADLRWWSVFKDHPSDEIVIFHLDFILRPKSADVVSKAYEKVLELQKIHD